MWCSFVPCSEAWAPLSTEKVEQEKWTRETLEFLEASDAKAAKWQTATRACLGSSSVSPLPIGAPRKLVEFWNASARHRAASVRMTRRCHQPSRSKAGRVLQRRRQVGEKEERDEHQESRQDPAEPSPSRKVANAGRHRWQAATARASVKSAIFGANIGKRSQSSANA